MRYFFTALIIIYIIALITLCCSGCNSGWLSGQGGISNQPTTPSGQLWHTVKKSNWLVTLAIPIIALGAVAMFNGAAKLGMSAIIFGAVNLFMALATARFALWMGIFGLVGSGLAVAASILVKNKALREFIKGSQNYKRGLRKEDADALATRFNIAQSNIQSDSTQRIVQSIKTNLKLHGEI